MYKKRNVVNYIYNHRTLQSTPLKYCTVVLNYSKSFIAMSMSYKTKTMKHSRQAKTNEVAFLKSNFSLKHFTKRCPHSKQMFFPRL